MTHPLTRSLIAFGGNQGDVSQTYAKVQAGLQTFPNTKLISASKLYTTSPVGANAGDMFLNAALEIETNLAPEALLQHLLELELALGRKRVIHWGPRIVDLDIITYGQEVSTSDQLVIPHPAAWYRRFVLDPIVEIAGQTVHPVKEVTFKELRDRLTKPKMIMLLVGGNFVQREDLSNEFEERYPYIHLESSDLFRLAMLSQHEQIQPSPTISFWLGGDDQAELELFRALPVISHLDATQLPQPLEESINNVIRSLSDIPRPYSE